jgi:hypothetical protein
MAPRLRKIGVNAARELGGGVNAPSSTLDAGWAPGCLISELGVDVRGGISMVHVSPSVLACGRMV